MSRAIRQAPVPTQRPVLALLAATLTAAGIACSGGPNDRPLDDEVAALPGATPDFDAAPGNDAGDTCAAPNEGCLCGEEGQTASCSGKAVRNGSYVFCNTGHRVCSGHQWGPCVLPKVY